MDRWKGLIRGLSLAAACAPAVLGATQTELLLFYDTEAFTSPYAAEGIREIARITSEEGLTAEFVTVGRLAEALEEWKRPDIIAAMAQHQIGSHTYGHSWHPVHAELVDALPYDEAYKRIFAEESKELKVLGRLFPNHPVLAYTPAGDNEPCVQQYVYRDLGVPIVGGVSFMEHTAGDLSYCGLLQLPYVTSYDKFLPGRNPCDPKAIADKLAAHRRAILSCHPQRNFEKQYWDVLNFKGKNPPPGQPYAQSPRWTETERAQYLADIRRTLRYLKADPRFRFTTVEAVAKSLPPRETMTRADVAFLRATLAASFGPVDARGWCLADVFRGAQRFLCGEDAYAPARECGFLERPFALASATEVAAEDLRAAAKALPRDGFLPSVIQVGAAKLGPRDFLMAALEVLATGAARVRVAPTGDPLGSFDAVPALRTKTYNCRDTWPIYDPAMKGARVAELARLQIWTLRRIR